MTKIENQILFLQQIKAVEPNLVIESWEPNSEGLVNDVSVLNQIRKIR